MGSYVSGTNYTHHQKEMLASCQGVAHQIQPDQLYQGPDDYGIKCPAPICILVDSAYVALGHI